MRNILNWIFAYIAGRKYLLPIISLVWGIISGFLITRNFSQINKLIVFSFALPGFSLLLNVFVLLKPKENKTNILHKIIYSIHQKQKKIEWLLQTGMQCYIQYILLFCIPFIFLAKSWLLLGIVILFAITTLWDPLWTKLIKNSIYESIIFGFAGAIAASFLYPIIFGKYMEHYKDAVLGFAILLAFPWGNSASLSYRWLYSAKKFNGKFIIKKFIKNYIGFIFVFTLIILVTKLKFIQISPLSVWLTNPKIGSSIVSKELKNPYPKNISLHELINNISINKELCCWTPLVAPGRMSAQVYHVWYINNLKIDTVLLPKIIGDNSQKSWRTWSCKKYIPKFITLESISCKVFLSPDIYVGETIINISP